MFLCSILLCTSYYMFRPRSVAIFRQYVHKIYIKVTTVYVNGSVESAATDPLTYTVVTLIYILCRYCLKMATDRGRNM
jgi:hypothetical protein